MTVEDNTAEENPAADTSEEPAADVTVEDNAAEENPAADTSEEPAQQM